MGPVCLVGQPRSKSPLYLAKMRRDRMGHPASELSLCRPLRLRSGRALRDLVRFLADLPRTYPSAALGAGWGCILSALRGWGGVGSAGRCDRYVEVKSSGRSLREQSRRECPVCTSTFAILIFTISIFASLIFIISIFTTRFSLAELRSADSRGRLSPHKHSPREHLLLLRFLRRTQKDFTYK